MPIQQQHAPLRVHNAVQRRQSPERPILFQISNVMYPKIQRRQVIMNVLCPSCAWPPRWSPPVLWRRFEGGSASICILIHSCKMPRESETVRFDESGGWLQADKFSVHINSMCISLISAVDIIFYRVMLVCLHLRSCSLCCIPTSSKMSMCQM